MQNRRLQYRLFSYGVINASKSLPISFFQNEELFVFLRIRIIRQQLFFTAFALHSHSFKNWVLSI